MDEKHFFCSYCNKELKISKNLINKISKGSIREDEAVSKAISIHNKKEHSLILGIKFKLFIENKLDKKKLNEYFDNYSKAVTFAARIFDKIRSPYKFIGLKDKNTKKWTFPKAKCVFCLEEKEVAYANEKDNSKICNECYLKEFGENGIRKKIYSTRGRKVEPKYNIFNSTKELSSTHYNYAIRDAFQLLDALKKQRQKKLKSIFNQKLRLKEFEDIFSDPQKRIELSLKPHQREKRYIHLSKSGQESINRGYTLRFVRGKIKSLTRNIEREEKSLRKKTPIHFKGNRLMIFPAGIKFDFASNKVKISISKNLPNEFNFSGTNVKNEHGKSFFKSRIELIKTQKPKYAYVLRKIKREYSKLRNYEIEKIRLENPNADLCDFYLQYTTETESRNNEEINGIIGIDRGITNLACLVLLKKGDKKPSGVKFYKGNKILGMKIAYRKHLYLLKGKRNKLRKQRQIRAIEPKINLILHQISKDIVKIAKEKNFAIALEQLEKPKKARFAQRKKEKYKLALFTFKNLSTLIEYKSKREGIPVIYVPPEKTSQMCSHCAINGDEHVDTQRPYKKPNAQKPSYSLFKCNKCGIELNADYNAAFNIAQKGLKTLMLNHSH